MAPRFRLSQAMGADYRADPADITSTKRALNRLGYYDDPEGDFGAWVDSGLFKGLRGFQKDNALKVDGFMAPGGETEAAIDRALARTTTTTDEPANDNQKPSPAQQEAWISCDQQFFLDNLQCDNIPPGPSQALCRRSAQARYSQCLSGKGFLKPLDKGGY